MIKTPMFFEEAINFLLDKEDLPAEWAAADWQEQEPDFRNRAFFSANVENARFLDRSHGLIFDFMVKTAEEIPQPDGSVKIALKTAGREHFVKRMRDFMIAEGMAKPEEFKSVNQKDVKDIRSLSRLRLIFDTNIRQAYGFGQWKQGMKPAVLRAFPAARLIRDRGVIEPRMRHQVNLGEVRLKTDPRWAEFHNDPLIGGFGVPWGPYGFNSGVTQEDVDLEEARALGLDVDSVASKPAKITDGTQASIKKMQPDIKAKLLEELRGGPKPRDPEEAAREAAAEVRREMLGRGLADAEMRGDSAKAAKYRKAIAETNQQSQGLNVLEEGEQIILNEGIGERLSKFGKSGVDATPDEQRAIAEKIFQTVDRKAAEPQTLPSTKKGAPRARHLFADELTFTPEETKILQSPHEILLIHDANGRLRNARLGNASEVSIPPDTRPDAILSHNHPSGRGPSDSDIKSVFAMPGRTLRVVVVNEDGKREIFSLRAEKELSDAEIVEWSALYSEECQRGGDTASARREALALIVEFLGDRLSVQTRTFQ